MDTFWKEFPGVERCLQTILLRILRGVKPVAAAPQHLLWQVISTFGVSPPSKQDSFPEN